jgi:1-deoxy-D-xylulose-5-phosphate synthase
LRYPKGSVPEQLPAVRRVEGIDVLREPTDNENPVCPAVLLICVDSLCELGFAAADRLADQGIEVTVVGPRWALPVPNAVVSLAQRHQLVVTVEDGGEHGGIGSARAAALRTAEIDLPLLTVALHSTSSNIAPRTDVLARSGSPPRTWPAGSPNGRPPYRPSQRQAETLAPLSTVLRRSTGRDVDRMVTGRNDHSSDLIR